ncbi:hypothetical protein B0H13DRAFT_2573607 [Mycena leptocephala]|nr:hypothetical protein B0H13DRAFT_2573607 [Mycena leptocephala]
MYVCIIDISPKLITLRSPFITWARILNHIYGGLYELRTHRPTSDTLANLPPEVRVTVTWSGDRIHLQENGQTTSSSTVASESSINNVNKSDRSEMLVHLLEGEVQVNVIAPIRNGRFKFKVKVKYWGVLLEVLLRCNGCTAYLTACSSPTAQVLSIHLHRERAPDARESRPPPHALRHNPRRQLIPFDVVPRTRNCDDAAMDREYKRKKIDAKWRRKGEPPRVPTRHPRPAAPAHRSRLAPPPTSAPLRPRHRPGAPAHQPPLQPRPRAAPPNARPGPIPHHNGNGTSTAALHLPESPRMTATTSATTGMRMGHRSPSPMHTHTRMKLDVTTGTGTPYRRSSSRTCTPPSTSMGIRTSMTAGARRPYAESERGPGAAVGDGGGCISVPSSFSWVLDSCAGVYGFDFSAYLLCVTPTLRARASQRWVSFCRRTAEMEILATYIWRGRSSLLLKSPPNSRSRFADYSKVHLGSAGPRGKR